jgi:hypothetical protein
MRWIAGLFTTVLLAGCLTAGPGACSSEEAAAFNEIDHFGEQPLAPEDHPLGKCAASFTTDGDPDVIVEHYRRVLPETGWTVLADDEAGGGTGVGLSASNGSMTFNVNAEILGGGEPTRFNVLVGKND